MNNAAGLFIGNFCQARTQADVFATPQVLPDITPRVMQGFSVAWWKDKHNTHHAAPNEVRDAQQLEACSSC